MVGFEMWRILEPEKQPYVAQKIRITASGATGDLQLVIDSGVLFDRDSLKGRDVVLDALTLVDCAVFELGHRLYSLMLQDRIVYKSSL